MQHFRLENGKEVEKHALWDWKSSYKNHIWVRINVKRNTDDQKVQYKGK